MRPDELTITNIHAVNRFHNSAGAHNRQACRPRFGLIYRYEGRTVYRSGERTFVSDADHVILLPRGSAYEWRCRESGHVISMECDCLQSADTPILLPVTNPHTLLERFTALERAVALHRSHAAVLRDAYALLCALTPNYQSSARRKQLSDAADYMALHLDRPVTNAELAKLVGLSEVYFRKLFTSHYGRSPIAYHQDLRIRKACQLLEGDAGSVGDIAAALGYANIYDFSRAFKTRLGVSPSKYKETD